MAEPGLAAAAPVDPAMPALGGSVFVSNLVVSAFTASGLPTGWAVGPVAGFGPVAPKPGLPARSRRLSAPWLPTNDTSTMRGASPCCTST